MMEDRITPSNVTYSILIKLYMKLGRYQDSLNIFQQMRENRVQPGLIVYTCLIQTCIKMKDMTSLL